MEATLEDGDKLVAPGWIDFLNHIIDRNHFSRDVRVTDPDPDPDEDVVEDPHPPKKVLLHPDDARLQQQIGDAQLPCTELHNFSQTAIETLAKDVVAMLIYHNNPIWDAFRQGCLAAHDEPLYHTSIRAAASLCFTLYNKLYLFRYGHECTVMKQMDALYELALAQRGVRGVKACADYEDCKSLVRLTADKEKYYFLTEIDLAEILMCFPWQFPPSMQNVYEGQVYEDIRMVVREMKLSSLPIFKVDEQTRQVDEQTRLLINLLKKESQDFNYTREFASVFMAMVRPDGLERFDKNNYLFVDLWVLLIGLATYIRVKLEGHLERVTAPLFKLNDPGCHISSEVLDIVEVAEIRRMALGSRFISRSHLIWAVYELGYGLPPKIRNAIKITSLDKDIPPYHIYVAAVKLAEYHGGKNMQLKLEHFLYAVIFAEEDIGFEGEEWEKMMAHFNDIVVDLRSSQE